MRTHSASRSRSNNRSSFSMVWIKRNLFFVLGAALALALLIFAGYYNYTENAAGLAAKLASLKLKAAAARARMQQAQQPAPPAGTPPPAPPCSGPPPRSGSCS